MRITKNEKGINPVELVKGLADPTRLRILALLVQVGGELCVCQIQGALGESQYKISRHLQVLRHSGWVQEQRRGRWVHYNLLAPVSQFHTHLLTSLGSLQPEFLELTIALDRIESLKKQNPCKEKSHE